MNSFRIAFVYTSPLRAAYSASVPYVGDQSQDPGEDDEPDDMARPELLDEPDQDYGEEDDASPHFDDGGGDV